ncbi:hypothetical protein BG000_003767 [Podila horticola]|nr:hypothetical protein BG000_003767 [Podila horticola]
MDKSLASKDSADNGSASLASLSFEILSELLDEIVLDVVSESHREVKNMRSICPICKTNTQAYDCVHCQRSFPAQRYAPHLEKCLGLAGRASSRVASRRMGAGERAGSGSPFTPMSYSDDREASDSDKDVVEKKRKKNNNNNNGGYASGNGSSSTKENGDYTAPSLSKSTSVSIKLKKPKLLFNRKGLKRQWLDQTEGLRTLYATDRISAATPDTCGRDFTGVPGRQSFTGQWADTAERRWERRVECACEYATETVELEPETGECFCFFWWLGFEFECWVGVCVRVGVEPETAAGRK